MRAHNGSWFAVCDGIELDGDGPASATYAVLAAIHDRTEREEHEAKRAWEALQARHHRLPDWHSRPPAEWSS